MLTRVLFTALWLCVVAQRLWEMRLSRRHERALRAAGAREEAPGQVPWMVALHAGWLAASLLEVWLLQRPFQLAIALPALALFMLGQSLRITAVRTLGARWSVRIFTLPEAQEPVSRGIYRYLRHPNYLGVALEIASFPLLHGAYLSALAFSVLNAFFLFARVRAEERALVSTSSYAQVFHDRPRFILRGRST